MFFVCSFIFANEEIEWAQVYYTKEGGKKKKKLHSILKNFFQVNISEQIHGSIFDYGTTQHLNHLFFPQFAGQATFLSPPPLPKLSLIILLYEDKG